MSEEGYNDGYYDGAQYAQNRNPGAIGPIRSSSYNGEGYNDGYSKGYSDGFSKFNKSPSLIPPIRSSSSYSGEGYNEEYSNWFGTGNQSAVNHYRGPGGGLSRGCIISSVLILILLALLPIVVFISLWLGLGHSTIPGM